MGTRSAQRSLMQEAKSDHLQECGTREMTFFIGPPGPGPWLEEGAQGALIASPPAGESGHPDKRRNAVGTGRPGREARAATPAKEAAGPERIEKNQLT